MKIATILAILWTLIYTIFIFTPLQNAVSDFNASNPVAPVVSAFPVLFLVISGVVTLGLAIEERRR